MKKSVTLLEMEYSKRLAVDEEMMYTARMVYFIKRPFRRLRYIWTCTVTLLQQLYWDMCDRQEWFWMEPTEAYKQAKMQKFKDFQWVCQSEKWLMEYLFRMEWCWGLWDPQTVDIEVTSTGPLFIELFREDLCKEMERALEPDYKKDFPALERLLESVPAVIMKDVGIRRAEQMKRWIEFIYDVKLTLIPKE